MRFSYFTLLGLTPLLLFPITVGFAETVANTSNGVLDQLNELQKAQDAIRLQLAPDRESLAINTDESRNGDDTVGLNSQLSKLAALPYAESTEPIKLEVLKCFGVSQGLYEDTDTKSIKVLEAVVRCSPHDLVPASSKLDQVAFGTQTAWANCHQAVVGSMPDTIPLSVFDAVKTDRSLIRALLLAVKRAGTRSSSENDVIDSCLRQLNSILNTAKVQSDFASIFGEVVTSLIVLETTQCAAKENPYECAAKAANLLLEFTGAGTLFPNGDGDGDSDGDGDGDGDDR